MQSDTSREAPVFIWTANRSPTSCMRTKQMFLITNSNTTTSILEHRADAKEKNKKNDEEFELCTLYTHKLRIYNVCFQNEIDGLNIEKGSGCCLHESQSNLGLMCFGNHLHVFRQVYIVLNGEDRVSLTKELQVPGCTLFQRNSQDTFIFR